MIARFDVPSAKGWGYLMIVLSVSL